MEELATVCNLGCLIKPQMEPEDLKALMPEIASAMDDIQEYIQDGVLRDPRPDISVEDVLEACFSQTEEKEIDDFRASDQLAQAVKHRLGR
ncbi:hypothetical protein FRC06_008951 [Ceratobasidium sp. 370]|nr:hypothetical protein FRC06_008951 [Ceratobasidium sp. 370]